MSKLIVTRTAVAMPANMEAARQFLFECLRGVTEQDNKTWRRFWNLLTRKEPGEMAEIEMVFPRHGEFHRRHMAMEQAVFNAQERFKDFDQFRYWLKVGAGWITWAAGPTGGVVPIPKSISYAKADEMDFAAYHAQAVCFLHGPHAAKYLWKHLGEEVARKTMDAILTEFGV